VAIVQYAVSVTGLNTDYFAERPFHLVCHLVPGQVRGLARMERQSRTTARDGRRVTGSHRSFIVEEM